MAIQFRRIGTRRGASAPSPIAGLQHVVGAAVNYDGYPGVTAGTLQQDIALLESRIRTVLGVTGLQYVGPHGYSGSSWPAAFSSTAVAFAPGVGYPMSFLNVKTGGVSSWAGVAAGNWDAHLTTYVNSVPDGHTHVFTVNHEPENDGPQPNTDGGAWQNANGPVWSQGIARLANRVAELNRPNVVMCVVHQGATFPANGQLGTLGSNQRNPEMWNPYKYMTAAARARTPFSPDFYTDMQSGGAFESFSTNFNKFINYNTDAGWGAAKYGVFEHTWNNDINATDAQVAAAWDSAKAYLVGLGDLLSHYVTFSEATGLASGVNGWADNTNGGAQPYTAKLTAHGNLVRTLNFSAPPAGGTGITFRVAATPTQANNATAQIVIPPTAVVGDYCLIDYGGTSTRSFTDPAGWTVLVSADSGNIRARWYLKKLASGEPGSTITLTLDGSTRWKMGAHVYAGVHATTPLDGPGGVATVGVASDNLGQTTHPAGSATSTGAGRMIVTAVWQRSGAIGGVNTGTTVWQPPTGYTLRSALYPSTLPGATGAAADLGNKAAGTYGPNVWTSDVAIGNFVGATLALIPA